jgi:hypothetical protein
MSDDEITPERNMSAEDPAVIGGQCARHDHGQGSRDQLELRSGN